MQVENLSLEELTVTKVMLDLDLRMTGNGGSCAAA
jgi:hypothetical protein